jgi:hypothetical protein
MRSRALAVFATSLVVCVSGLLSNQARAQAEGTPAVANSAPTPIGRVISITGTVTIEHANAVVVQANLGQSGRTKMGDPVFMGDVVQTAADGKVGITFTDGTAFNLSSNARMVLNEFVYDPNGRSNSTLFSLTKGTFTFVAGKIAKTGDMKIDTPVATMGIRGTTPHVEISDNGTVKFSTLIEEGKNRVIEKTGSLPKQRQAKSAAQPGSESTQQPELRVTKPNLTICRGC